MPRPWLSRTLALLLALSPASAQEMMGTGPFFLDVVRDPQLTFLQCTNAASAGTQFTFTGANVGAEDPTRATIVGFIAEDGATVHTLTSATIGGASATEVVDNGAASGIVNAGIYIMANPLGTAEDIVVNISEALTQQEMVACVWRATNLQSLTAVSSASSSGVSGANLTLNLSGTTLRGIAVGVCGDAASATDTATWTGLTESSDADLGNEQTSTADLRPTVGGALNVSCDYTGTSDVAGATAAFR